MMQTNDRTGNPLAAGLAAAALAAALAPVVRIYDDAAEQGAKLAVWVVTRGDQPEPSLALVDDMDEAVVLALVAELQGRGIETRVEVVEMFPAQIDAAPRARWLVW